MRDYKRLTIKGGDWYGDVEYDDEARYNRLTELEDKIESGLLLELPCKVGDMVYFPVDNGFDYAEIDEIHIFENDIVFEWVQYDRGYELTELWDEGDFSICDIGNTVFLTIAEAEARLKEMRDER